MCNQNSTKGGKNRCFCMWTPAHLILDWNVPTHKHCMVEENSVILQLGQILEFPVIQKFWVRAQMENIPRASSPVTSGTTWGGKGCPPLSIHSPPLFFLLLPPLHRLEEGDGADVEAWKKEEWWSVPPQQGDAMPTPVISSTRHPLFPVQGMGGPDWHLIKGGQHLAGWLEHGEVLSQPWVRPLKIQEPLRKCLCSINS